MIWFLMAGPIILGGACIVAAVIEIRSYLAGDGE